MDTTTQAHYMKSTNIHDMHSEINVGAPCDANRFLKSIRVDLSHKSQVDKK